ncbi:MAG: DUF2779 domain-containing protein [Erysipelotrichaceae bacterium]|nr:DUF2779 domain-containing protein [Erysipelotrichaceae bacterium]
MYHISDLKRFVRCPRYYFLSLQKEVKNPYYLRSDESVIELLVRHLRIDEHYQGVMGDTNDRFFNEKDNYQWFVKTRFEDDGLRIRIPLMYRNNDSYTLYFIFNGTNLRELDLLYYRINIEILRKLGLKIENVFIAYINGSYVFDEELDVDELFILTDVFKERKLIDIFDDSKVDYKEIISRIESNDLDSCPAKKTGACHHRGVCPYYYECFQDELTYPEDSILTLVSSQHKVKMFEKGIRHLKDADLDLVEGNRVQFAQIQASKNGGLFVDKYNLLDYLKKFDTRPISFIDFEWDTYLVPQYKGMKVLDVLPFEFALYVLDENDNLKNYTFVGNKDCRRDFAEDLIKKVPKTGPVVAYNAMGAECRRINELAEQFPDLSKDLMAINKRFVDLAVPFIEGIVYDTRMRGNFTLKKLVSVVSDLTYKDLDINDGLKAVFNWRELDMGKEDVDDEKILKDLIEYCSLDAYGLYLVYKWLLELT